MTAQQIAEADATAGILFLLLFMGALLLAVWCIRKLKPRNKYTRGGWDRRKDHIKHASCRSGWRAHTQQGHRY